MLSKDGSTIVVACRDPPSVIIKSTDLGKTWTRLPKISLQRSDGSTSSEELAISRDASILAVTLGNLGALAILS